MNVNYEPEYQYIKRQTEAWNGFTSQITRRVTIIAVILAAVVLLIAFDEPDFLLDIPRSSTGFMVYGLGAYVVIWHFRTIYLTLNLSRYSLASRRKPTWEWFVITGASSRQVVWSKWWVVVSLTWREFLWLGVLRASVLIIVTMYQSLDRYYLWVVPDFDPPEFVLGAGLVILFTMVNCLFTAAAGITGTMTKLFSGTVIRTVLVMFPLGVLIAYAADFDNYTTELLVLDLAGTILTNGASLMEFAQRGLDVTIILIALGFYAVVTVLALGAAVGFMWWYEANA